MERAESRVFQQNEIIDKSKLLEMTMLVSTNRHLEWISDLRCVQTPRACDFKDMSNVKLAMTRMLILALALGSQLGFTCSF